MRGSLPVKPARDSAAAAAYDSQWWAGMILTTQNANLASRGYGPRYRDQMVADAACSFVIQYLDTLAASQHDALAQLRVRNIRGSRMSSAYCVISTLVYHAIREPIITNGYIVKLKRGTAWASLPLPHLWVTIADGFDRGYYPDLVNRNGKETDNDGRSI